MKSNGDYELADVPRLMRSFNETNDLRAGIAARGVMMDACEALIDGAERESRALTADERRGFDLYSSDIRSINAELKRRKQERASGLVALGIDPSEARYCY